MLHTILGAYVNDHIPDDRQSRRLVVEVKDDGTTIEPDAPYGRLSLDANGYIQSDRGVWKFRPHSVDAAREAGIR